jgi:TBCC domain-containing protein 1
MDTFEHLGFLVQFSEGTSLSQAANFFANSPDMPAAPVPAVQVFDWISQNMTSSLESNHQTVSDLDVTMTEANTSHPWNSTPSANPAYYRNITFVEGFSKTSIVKHASDVKGNSIKVH